MVTSFTISSPHVSSDSYDNSSLRPYICSPCVEPISNSLPTDLTQNRLYTSQSFNVCAISTATLCDRLYLVRPTSSVETSPHCPCTSPHCPCTSTVQYPATQLIMNGWFVRSELRLDRLIGCLEVDDDLSPSFQRLTQLTALDVGEWLSNLDLAPVLGLPRLNALSLNLAWTSTPLVHDHAHEGDNHLHLASDNLASLKIRADFMTSVSFCDDTLMLLHLYWNIMPQVLIFHLPHAPAGSIYTRIFVARFSNCLMPMRHSSNSPRFGSVGMH